MQLRSRTAPVPGREAGKCSRCGGSGKEPAPSKLVKAKAGVRVGDVCPKCEGSGRNVAGGNFRNYTHAIEETADGTYYANWSKGEKPQILAFLRRQKRGAWICAVADSGQKHVLPYAPINPSGGGGGAVLMDDTRIDLPEDDAGWSIVDDATALLTAGGTKEGLETGRYADGSWSRCAPLLLAFEERYGHLRGGSWFDLAVWLAQADQAAVEERLAREKDERVEKARAAKEAAKKPKEKKADVDRGRSDGAEARTERARRTSERATPDAHGGTPARPADGVPAEPERQRVEGAGDPPKPQQGSVAHVPKPGRVGHARRAEPRDPAVGQLRIPGFD
ncbi:MAG: hypothetical protein FJY54_18185 [Betaproteobacteria bacterium]|nr:hypothetical protein [Betaproteobacteria bacterium]